MSIYLTKIIFNNKVFAIYVNENGHKSFLQIENDKLIEPQKDDYESLNDLFNPDKNICYDILDDFLKLQEKQEENNKNISPKKSNKFDLKKVLYVLLSLNIGVTSFHITSIYHAFQNHISIQKSYSNQIWKIKHISPNLLNKQIEENQIILI